MVAFRQSDLGMSRRDAERNSLPRQNEVANGVFVRSWSEPPEGYTGMEAFFGGTWYRIEKIDKQGCTGVEINGLDQIELPVTTDDFDLAYHLLKTR